VKLSQKLENIAITYGRLAFALTEVNHLAAATEASEMSKAYYSMSDDASLRDE
jgi:hypothetical protein